jgi:hypothetical protein
MNYIAPTAASVLHSATHGRQRREERNIEKIDLQRARRYGMRENARRGRIKYTYGGVVFIYDPVTNSEVTSFPSPDRSLETSGTKVSKPIILPRKNDYDDPSIKEFRDSSKAMLDRSAWTSHSILVVDMSGSMRRDDVNGAKCRSDGVWMALARDYVQKPLEMKTRSKTDVISVIVMKDEATVLLKYEPTDWVLYNKLIDLREWTQLRPSGPGNYMPALEKAERLLKKNINSKCSLSLFFFSDGKPSDRGDFAGKMGNIASQFGRRLSIACIGMAEMGEDFSTLNDMVTEAQSYGAKATFGKPSLDADSLSNIVTTLASSVTTSMTEMTNIETGTLRKVRMDLRREKVNTPDDLVLTSEWSTYETATLKHYVSSIWSWDCKLNDFVEVIDHRCADCWKMTNVFRKGEGHAIGDLCAYCGAVCFCVRCHLHAARRRGKALHPNCSRCLQDRRVGKLILKEDIPSFDIALKEPIFGEGAERIVRKLRYIRDKRFIGPVMVAKESRFLSKDGTSKQHMDYHREFMRTQAIAAEYAKRFNEALDDIPNHFSPAHHELVRRKTSKFPRIEFLEPLVIEVIDETKRDDTTNYNILVEPMLEGRYEKFNDNMGMVRGEAKSLQEKDLIPRGGKNSLDDLSNLVQNLSLGNLGGHGLGAIEEGSEDEDGDEDEDDSGALIEADESKPMEGSYVLSNIKKEHIPQTFSHFTYQKSKKCLMVVDLQGVLYEDTRDGNSVYKLTDPVIHKQKIRNRRKFRHWSFGRTDRGKKGRVLYFMNSHNFVTRALYLTNIRYCPIKLMFVELNLYHKRNECIFPYSQM